MPIGALKKASTGQNGLKSFILPLRRLDFHYSDWAGSSRGMNLFLRHVLPSFAAAHPSVEIHVSPRGNNDPLVRAHYINGGRKEVCVRMMEKEQILDRVEMLRDGSGEKERRLRKHVASLNESVRGVWSPFHARAGVGRWRI